MERELVVTFYGTLGIPTDDMIEMWKEVPLATFSLVQSSIFKVVILISPQTELH